MKALVTSEFPPEAIARLRAILGDDVTHESWRDTRNLHFDAARLVQRIKETGASILICEGDNVKKDVIDHVDLKIIGSTRDDPNNVDIDAATAKGIPVLFAPKRNTIAVAELAVGLILALARKLHLVDRKLHSTGFKVDEFADYVDNYNAFKGFELHGKVVGIVGLGSIGFEVATRLAPFGVSFLVHDPYVQPGRLAAIGARAVDLDHLLRHADVVTVHCPPTDETDGLLDAGRIALMKPTAVFVNLARASITDEDALLDALRSKRIAGAALDVFAVEPVDQENPFLELDNVIVTPHLGGDTVETNARHAAMIIDGIEVLARGGIPFNVANPGVLHGARAPAPVPPSSFLAERVAIIEACKAMVAKGFIVSTAGNVSARVRLPGGPDAFLVTPSTVDYAAMQPGDVVLVDETGAVIEGTRNPSSERRLHLAIYHARPDIRAIIHSHAPFSTALSIARMPIEPVVDEIIPFIGGCKVAAYGMAGTDELASSAVEALGENYAVFIANHGNVCCGTSMQHAWDVCQLVEHAARIQYHASLLGPMHALPEDAEEHEREIFEIMRDAGPGGED